MARKQPSHDPREQSQFPIKVDRNVYPRPEYRFPDAKIGMTYESSKPDFPPPNRAPEGSPNVLLVLLDDVGYGWMNGFGGLIESPTVDRLAKTGLKYCQFHTTALCSPTRAALLTGRNHHTVASGVIQELATGYPGYCGIIPKSCATVAELLHQNGYSTGWWGKNHNVPDNHTSPAGPFDNWPTHQGFDYFYGFIAGETDQFYPALYRGTEPVDPPALPEEGYHLTRDLADDCIAWMRQQKAIAPGRPFFAYFATGAGHAPHHPPLDWRGRHKGRFDMGWDEYRKQVHQRQLEMGVIPEGTRLTERPAEIPSWDSRSPDEKRLYARFAENYADFMANTEYQTGRLVDALEGMGELENTLIFYIVGDNGSSAEGTLSGTLNEIMTLGGIQPTLERNLARIDEIGLPGTSPHYPVGWAWAGDTPFQWTKQVASHLGGTRNGMVVSWPKRITDQGGLRFQFHHVIDVLPTILEVVGISEPTMVNGVPQKPVEGVSMAYTFAKKAESAPSKRYLQYFEMFGHRALYNDGWLASCRHGRLPWIGFFSAPFEDDKWELYDIAKDFSQSEDLASGHPEKLRELQDLFMAQASLHNVLPLDDRATERMDTTLRPGFFYGREKVVLYPGMVRLPEGSGPKTDNVDHRIRVSASVPEEGAEGVLICLGGDTGGWSMFIRDRRLVYHYNWYDVERYEAVSDVPVPSGDVELEVLFAVEGKKAGGPAQVRLAVNGAVCGEAHIDRQVTARFGIESFDVGVDKLSPVCKTYPEGKPGFPFTGGIRSVTFDFEGKANELSLEERFDMMLKME
ncbi:MAG TPA: arylsulfatase [Fibrobacteria bacterium]|nr:arylsulfatase [Fibrobacteria bacterium]